MLRRAAVRRLATRGRRAGGVGGELRPRRPSGVENRPLLGATDFGKLLGTPESRRAAAFAFGTCCHRLASHGIIGLQRRKVAPNATVAE